MPQRYVKFIQGFYYHVFNRGTFQETVFHNHEHYLYCLRLLRKNVERFSVSVIVYCLMPNHYHFLIRPDSVQGLSECIGYTFNSYAQAVNKQLGRNGPIFQGPFKAILVDKDEYLMHLCRYIHLNPVKADLVQRPEHWPYSNYREWVSGTSQGTWCSMEVKKSILFDQTVMDMYFENGQEYRKFVEEEIDLPDGFDKYLMD